VPAAGELRTGDDGVDIEAPARIGDHGGEELAVEHDVEARARVRRAQVDLATEREAHVGAAAHAEVSAAIQPARCRAARRARRRSVERIVPGGIVGARIEEHETREAIVEQHIRARRQRPRIVQLLAVGEIANERRASRDLRVRLRRWRGNLDAEIEHDKAVLLVQHGHLRGQRGERIDGIERVGAHGLEDLGVVEDAPHPERAAIEVPRAIAAHERDVADVETAQVRAQCIGSTERR
jgi:hypothetical protein